MSDDLRDRLIATTIDLLGSHEPTELSLRRVARELGVSSGAPYHHFEDKPALFGAVALDAWNRLAQRLAGGVDGPIPTQLRAMGVAYLSFAMDHPSEYRVMFLPELRDPTRFPALHQASLGTLHLLRDLLAAELCLSPEDPELMGRVVAAWSTVHGFAVLHNAGVLAGKTDHVPPEVMLDAIADASVRAGLA